MTILSSCGNLEATKQEDGSWTVCDTVRPDWYNGPLFAEWPWWVTQEAHAELVALAQTIDAPIPFFVEELEMLSMRCRVY